MSMIEQRSQIAAISADMKSIGSRDITLSLSSPRSGEEVSWSSSDGSSYDTVEDLARLRFGTTEYTKANVHFRDLFPPSLPRTEKQNNIPSTEKQQINNPRNSIQCDIESIVEDQPDPPKSRLMRPFTRTNPESRPRLEDVLPKHRPKQTRGVCVLNDVDVYSAVEQASAGREDVSAICFLTKEDTNQVFTTKRIVPIEVATKRSMDEISAVSTSIAGSTESVEGVDDFEELSQRVVHHMRPNSKEQNGTDMETEVQNMVDAYPKTYLSNTVDPGILHEVVIYCQRTISSLESSSTWDSQQDGSHTAGSGSEDAVRGRQKAHAQDLQVDAAELFQKVSLSAKHSPTIDCTSRNNNIPDIIMDERIKRLKEKIKSLQHASNLEEQFYLENVSASDANEDQTGVESVSIESTVSGLPSEAVTTLAPTFISNQVPSSRLQNNDRNRAMSSSKLSKHSTSRSTSKKHPRSSLKAQRERGRSPGEHLTVPTTISATCDLEEISLMECNSTSTSQFAATHDNRIDIELAELFDKQNSLTEKDEWYSQVSKKGKDYAIQITERAKIMSSLLVAHVQAQNQAFQKKSRSEKAVTIFIAACLFVFFILLLSLIP